MCGIVSYFSNTTAYDRDIHNLLAEMIACDTVRGGHSTGIMYEDDTNVYTFKKAMSGFDFIQLAQAQQILRNYHTSRFLVGHNRAATVGTVNQTNAHPFQHGHITGVHNGTLINHRTLVKGTFNSQVDSEYIFKALSEADKTKDVIEEINGAFALIWYDAKNDTIHFIRNDERPYTLAKVKGADIVLGASEGDMLTWLAKRNNLSLEESMQPAPMVEHVFNWDNLAKPRAIKHKEYISVGYGYNNHNGYYQRGSNDNFDKKGKHSNVTNLRGSTRKEMKKIEFCPLEFVENDRQTNPDGIIYGRYIGTALNEDQVIVYQCYKDELDLGTWYEGLCNKNDNHDGRYTVQRSSIKKLKAGPHDEELFSCMRCNDMKFTTEVLFVDNEPHCFECCRELSIASDEDNVEFRPPKHIVEQDSVH